MVVYCDLLRRCRYHVAAYGWFFPSERCSATSWTLAHMVHTFRTHTRIGHGGRVAWLGPPHGQNNNLMLLPSTRRRSPFLYVAPVHVPAARLDQQRLTEQIQDLAQRSGDSLIAQAVEQPSLHEHYSNLLVALQLDEAFSPEREKVRRLCCLVAFSRRPSNIGPGDVMCIASPVVRCGTLGSAGIHPFGVSSLGGAETSRYCIGCLRWPFRIRLQPPPLLVVVVAVLTWSLVVCLHANESKQASMMRRQERSCLCVT